MLLITAANLSSPLPYITIIDVQSIIFLYLALILFSLPIYLPPSLPPSTLYITCKYEPYPPFYTKPWLHFHLS